MTNRRKNPQVSHHDMRVEEDFAKCADRLFSSGCRAASFDRDGTWDDSLDRRWKASPPRAHR